MDSRKALTKGSVLSFPGMDCTIQTEIGRGSNAIVYQGSYPDALNSDERHIVLIKELFPFHQKEAVYRNDDGEIVCAPDAREFYELHRASFDHGNRIHLKMLEGHPELTGSNINTFYYNSTHYTLLGYTGGRSLEAEANGPAGDLKQLVLRMMGLLDALDAFHENGFLHLDIAPDNVLLIGQGRRERVMLIDYNSAYDMNAAGYDPYAYYSIKQGFTASEICSGRLNSVSVCSDLYSVAAVFYRCISGNPLTAFQTSRPTPPSINGYPCIEGMPDTVGSMVRQILYKGLHILPRNRYQSVSEMYEAFRELLDRIEGVGVTHWALWEAGKKTVHRIIKNNPSYSYLTETDELYPANVTAADSVESVTLDEYLTDLLGENGVHTLLTAQGGMGKTTALLRTMLSQASRYSAKSPAFAYIPLGGRTEGRTTYIQDKILENLRYTADTVSFEDARHILHRIMETPISTKNGNVPSLLLLLDGFNEAGGSTQALSDEITELSRLDGVRILMTSRSGAPHLPLREVGLSSLSKSDVAEILYRHKLLMPESETMQELLCTPLMLSIFVRSAEAEQKQMMVSTQDELLDAYFTALRNKEFAELDEDAGEKWQIEVALDLILPEIAGQISKNCRALRDDELLDGVAYCYKLFSSGLLRRAFPQWIGHNRAIRGSAGNAEEWYGMIVHDILWKKLGVLVRDDSGAYQIIHSIICEYLVDRNAVNVKRIRLRRRLKTGIIVASAILCLVIGAVTYRQVIAPPRYSEMLADATMAYGTLSYQNFNRQYEQLKVLLERGTADPETYESELYYYTNYPIPNYPKKEDVEAIVESMLDSGRVMPWSGECLDVGAYYDLIDLPNKYSKEYSQLIKALTYVMENERAYERFGEVYVDQLNRLLEKDAEIIALLYQASCREHLNERYDPSTAEKYGVSAVEIENYRKVLESQSGINKYFNDTESAEDIYVHVYEDLYRPRDDLMQEIVFSGVLGMADAAIH